MTPEALYIQKLEAENKRLHSLLDRWIGELPNKVILQLSVPGKPQYKNRKPVKNHLKVAA